MVVGNTNEIASKAYCDRQYWLIRNSQLYWTLQNTWSYPNAQTYVQQLFREAPEAASPPNLKNQLAVITNITSSGSSYHVAEELAITAGMHVILLGKSLRKLKLVEETILREARRRGMERNEAYRKPTIHRLEYDTNSLQSVLPAAKDVERIAIKYSGKISLLIHNPSGVTPSYAITKEGVESNLGKNYVAPHVLTQQLLPLLKQAATPTYKPRIVFVSSVGHCQGTDLDPHRLERVPQEGGAPEGILIDNAGSAASADDATTTATTKVYAAELDGPVQMYYRSTMALIANAMALAQEEPSLAPFSVYPGSVATSQKQKSLGIAETIYQTGFYMFNLSARQGARATLRAALDPDINSGALPSGSYLHCDGNPWTPAATVVENPATGAPYEDLMEYAVLVRDCTKRLCARLLEGKPAPAVGYQAPVLEDHVLVISSGDDKTLESEGATASSSSSEEEEKKEDLGTATTADGPEEVMKNEPAGATLPQSHSATAAAAGNTEAQEEVATYQRLK